MPLITDDHLEIDATPACDRKQPHAIKKLVLGRRETFGVPNLFERYGWMFHVAIVAITIYCIARS